MTDDKNLSDTSSSVVSSEHHTNTNDGSTSPVVASSDHRTNTNDGSTDNNNDINESYSITNSTVTDTVGWIWVVSNVIFEILAAIFDQLSSPKHAVFALASMMTSFAAFGICIIEVVYHCHQEKDKSRKRAFSNFRVTVGLACALCQWIFGIISYIYYRQHHDNPIKLSIVSVVLAMGLCISKFFKDREDRVEGDQGAEIV